MKGELVSLQEQLNQQQKTSEKQTQDMQNLRQELIKENHKYDKKLESLTKENN